ncbi:uncharacterized protein LOC122648258, partial [Telopea speciosissima]|uniref:uncharacterized protein LOC122648258 n=1 Tax=Telopea speciosissima TaxID=54955 RepID=UPI001CC79A40
MEIKKVCKDHEVNLVGLFETKVKLDNCASIFHSFLTGWKYLHNGDLDNSIRIWLGWDPNFYDVVLVQKSKQFIHAKVSIVGTSVFFFCTVVYALNSVVARKELWEDVGAISSAIINPWAVLGDFNVIRSNSEKIGGYPVRIEAMDDFNSFIDGAGLLDLKWKGEALTWNNRQVGDARICCKLDRVLVNLAWMDVFRSSDATFYPPGLSDHSPVVVAVGWEQPMNLALNPILKFAARLRNVKKGLRSWNKECVGDVFLVVKEAEAELFQIQRQLSEHPDDPNLVLMETQAKKKFWEALATEEKFLKEKQHRKHILEIQGENGDIVKNPSQIKEEAISFYKKLFGTDSADSGFFPSSIPLKHGLSQAHQESLTRRISNKEIMEVVFAFKNSKAPGPDGFGAAFYKHSWEIVGEDLTLAVKWFFMKSYLPSSVNATFISLIPKTGDVTSFMGYRPIALCNLFYKIITKVLSNRLQGVIGQVVSDCQSTFIKGRSIVENILVCHDVVRGIEQKGTSPTAILKIDLHKAYDSLTRRSRLDGWKAWLLSFAGRLQLLNSVLQGCYIYWSGLFGLLGALKTMLESMFSNFLWVGPSLHRKVRWAAVIPKACVWPIPPADLFTLHCDGSLSGDRAAYGGLIRNTLGDPRELRHMSIRSDSKLAIEILTGVSSCPWSVYTLKFQILSSLNQLAHYEIRHVWRELNQPADFIASIDLSDGETILYPSSFVEDLNRLIYDDVS